jgi:hypothetical protein
VAAPVELGRGAGGEDPQHRELVLARLEPAARQHADVAHDVAVGAAHRDGEVALERMVREERVRGEARDAARRVADHVALGDRLARGPGELVLEALGQQLAARPGGEHACALGGEQLGHVRHVRGEGGRQAARQRAQERRADGARRALCDRSQQVALIALGACW